MCNSKRVSSSGDDTNVPCIEHPPNFCQRRIAGAHLRGRNGDTWFFSCFGLENPYKKQREKRLAWFMAGRKLPVVGPPTASITNSRTGTMTAWGISVSRTSRTAFARNGLDGAG